MGLFQEEEESSCYHTMWNKVLSRLIIETTHKYLLENLFAAISLRSSQS